MGRRGRVESVVRGVLGPMVAAGELSGVDLITVEACFAAATLADRARVDGKVRESLTALRDLRDLLADLGLKGGAGGRSGGDSEPADGDGVGSLLGAGPELGD